MAQEISGMNDVVRGGNIEPSLIRVEREKREFFPRFSKYFVRRYQPGFFSSSSHRDTDLIYLGILETDATDRTLE